MDRRIDDELRPGIDPRTGETGGRPVPYNAESFAQMRVVETWEKYDGVLTWGRGQTLAILDDGCDLSVPEWSADPGKVAATWNSVDGNEDCSPVPPGYHGTSVGYPSSLNHDGVRGIAYDNRVAHVRCVSVVHLRRDESETLAAGLQWVIDRCEDLGITAVNLSPLDDQAHREPVPTVIDEKLERLRELNVWVSAPCGNNGHTDGISWPACQPYCFAIGATRPGEHAAHLDRFANTDLLVAAKATSSSNAYAAACAMILREAIDKSGYPWQDRGNHLPDALMDIFRATGPEIPDADTGLVFRELDLLAAVVHVFTATH